MLADELRDVEDDADLGGWCAFYDPVYGGRLAPLFIKVDLKALPVHYCEHCFTVLAPKSTLSICFSGGLPNTEEHRRSEHRDDRRGGISGILDMVATGRKATAGAFGAARLSQRTIIVEICWLGCGEPKSGIVSDLSMTEYSRAT